MIYAGIDNQGITATGMMNLLERHPAYGIIASVLGSAITFLHDLELIFRVTGAGIGVAIGVMTVVSTWPKFARAGRKILRHYRLWRHIRTIKNLEEVSGHEDK